MIGTEIYIQTNYLKLFIKKIVSKQKVFPNGIFQNRTTIKYKLCISII